MMRLGLTFLLGLVCVPVLLFHAAARAAAPAGRYTVNVGTVLDNKTKLTWQQPPASSTMTWSSAQTYCAGVGSTLGGTGWRLPTKKELLTLVDFAQSTSPFIDPSAFPNTPNSPFWSSTPAGSAAWIVAFYGELTTSSVASNTLEVRCVH